LSFRANTIIIHYGEIALKGKNRPLFLRRLKQNLVQKLKSLGVGWPIQMPYGYCYIELPPDYDRPLDPVLKALGQVAGVAWYAPARHLPAKKVKVLSDTPNYSLIDRHVVQLAKSCSHGDVPFRVQVKRSEKRFPKKSPKMEKRLGNEIIKNTQWKQVDLKNPEQIFYVNIQTEGVFLHAQKLQGQGGLPVGITGRVLALLSGGIDSPAAAYLATRRGCAVDFVHFTATPRQQNQPQDYKISKLVQILSQFTLHSRLYLVPYTHFEMAVLGEEIDYELVIFRRFMMRVAERLAHQRGAQALVTGDSLAQVASQTLENLVSNSQAVKLPILRPLLTFDKLEIIDLAKQINTYRTSVKPYKDCCSILSKNPKTKSRHKIVTGKEQQLLPNYEALIERTLADVACLDYTCGQPANTISTAECN